ncbi:MULTISPECIES: chemotaxis protein CheW [Helicobacter]|uniref:Chemotaxis protein CheW n=3 Tax=Helicobacter typhlonius TaxID=76936 RepID=A0A099UBC4_9HELI|nr:MULTISPECIES: chemotaxis protein CheW [Helicobacter]TLD78225.1 chemotaxis protein CheW [Helicobacter typhlonius]TLD86878.1 chemotaxis protein CheW [Helicobacter sp. MIT 03-1616]CUU40708.1 Positive regulator of CheA protein activity (CheW) [Helicobacter typhlonius]HCD72647.1 chemotaxis protein CheW [Helicobacter sp.]
MSDNKLKEVLEKQQNKGEDATSVEKTLHIIGFMIGNEEFAVPILNVKEIIKPIEYTRVPAVPNYVLGVFNLRGTVLPLISMRLKFGLSAIKQDADTRFLVVTQRDEMIGFMIDRLTSAIRIPENDIEPIPETFNENQNLLQGIGKREDRLITILNVENLLKRDF